MKNIVISFLTILLLFTSGVEKNDETELLLISSSLDSELIEKNHFESSKITIYQIVYFWTNYPKTFMQCPHVLLYSFGKQLNSFKGDTKKNKNRCTQQYSD